MIRNPVMFVVEVVATLTTVIFLQDLLTGGAHLGFTFQIILWLWITVLFANFAEAVAEGRGKAQAASLRRARTDTMANRITATRTETVPAPELKQNDLVLVAAGELIPSDGEVIEGIASIDKSAITGESAPVIRESGGDRSAVTGGTRVLSDWIKVRITAAQGSTFLDRMIALVEGAERQKTPNEIALNILLAGLTIIFVIAVATIPSFATYAGGSISVVILVALFVALIPTTIGALLSAIGIAGMDRLVRFNVLAMSGRAVEAAGDVDTLLLDKTGTITLGNRQATEFFPLTGVTRARTGGCGAVVLAARRNPGRPLHRRAGEGEIRHPRARHGAAGRAFRAVLGADPAVGIDFDGSSIRKGAVDAVLNWVRARGAWPRRRCGRGAERGRGQELTAKAEKIAKAGGTPLAVAKDGKLLGVIYLKDIVKGGIRERFSELRRMGIRTVMITGDNPLTAAAIAAEAGVDDFLAQATPEAKLKLIRDEQAQGKLVACAATAPTTPLPWRRPMSAWR